MISFVCSFEYVGESKEMNELYMSPIYVSINDLGSEIC